MPSSSSASQSWQCSLCHLTNDEGSLQCQLCGAPRQQSVLDSTGPKRGTDLEFSSESVQREAIRTRQMHAEVERLSSLVQGEEGGTSMGQGSGAACSHCSELLYQTNVVLDALCALTSDILRTGLPRGARNQESTRVGLRELMGQVLDTCNKSPKPELLFKDDRLKLTHGMLQDFFNEIGGQQCSMSCGTPKKDVAAVQSQQSLQGIDPSFHGVGRSHAPAVAHVNSRTHGFEIVQDPPSKLHHPLMFERGGAPDAQSSLQQRRPLQNTFLREELRRASKFPALDLASPTRFAASSTNVQSPKDVFSWWTSDPNIFVSQRRQVSHPSVEVDLEESISEALQWSWWDEDEAHRRATKDPVSPGLQEARTIKEWMSEFEGTNPNDFSRLQNAHQFLRSTLEETGIKHLKKRPVTGRRGTEPFLLPTKNITYRDTENERRRLMNNSTRLPETLQEAVDKLNDETTRPCGPTPWLLPGKQPTASGTGYMDSSAEYYDDD